MLYLYSMIGRTFAPLFDRMQFVHRAFGRWRSRQRPRYALALAGGGVIGGMYEVGALAALEERLNGAGRGFDIYVGCSAGSVVASLLAGGVRAREIYQILEEDLDDAINFRRNAVFAGDAFRRACGRFGRLIWAFGKSAIRGRGSIPDMLARAERDMPPGFFSLDALESYLRTAFASPGLSNAFAGRPRTLLQPPGPNGLLFGPSMGFEASRAALRYGYASTKEWLDQQGAPLVRRLLLAAA